MIPTMSKALILAVACLMGAFLLFKSRQPEPSVPSARVAAPATAEPASGVELPPDATSQPRLDLLIRDEDETLNARRKARPPAAFKPPAVPVPDKEERARQAALRLQHDEMMKKMLKAFDTHARKKQDSD